MNLHSLVRTFVSVGAVGVASALAQSPPATLAEGVEVTVQRSGSVVIVDALVHLPVSPEEAWATISDYDHMTDFLPGLVESKVLTREGNRLRVVQKGHATRGPLSFSFENVRDIDLTPPTEIRTQ